MNDTSNERGETSRPTVLLVHGFLAHRLLMWPLERSLAAAGFDVHNLGYSSWGSSIETIAERLGREVRRHRRPHVVTHSMGGILLRTLHRDASMPLGRVVMLAPPNRGSHVATWLGPRLERFVPALDQLADRSDGFLAELPPEPDFECGIIAAERDHVVPLSSTHLPNQADHLVLPGRHGTLPLRRDVAREVVHFLQHGRFRANQTVDGTVRRASDQLPERPAGRRVLSETRGGTT